MKSMSGNQQGNFATVVLDEIIELVAEQMAMGGKKHAIKRFLEDEIFKCKISIQSYEKLRSRARKLLRDSSDVTVQDHKAMSIDFYRQFACNTKLPAQSRIRAMENLDDIYGIKDQDELDSDPAKKAALIRKTLQEAEQSVGANDDTGLDIA